MNKLALVVFLTACGDTSSDRCADAVGKLLGPSGADWERQSEDDKQRALARRAGMTTAMTESCRAQSWSAEMFDCIDNAANAKASFRPCERLLTSEQVTAVKAAVEKTAIVEAEADRSAKEAAWNATQAAAAVAALERQVADLTAKIKAAVEALAAARSQGERDAANATLTSLRQDTAKLEAQLADAKANAARAARRNGIRISKECVENPAAKGC